MSFELDYETSVRIDAPSPSDDMPNALSVAGHNGCDVVRGDVFADLRRGHVFSVHCPRRSVNSASVTVQSRMMLPRTTQPRTHRYRHP